MCIFKKFKDVLGEQNKGIHKYKFLNTSILDYLGTIVLAIITTLITGIPFVLTTIIWFILSVILHWLFGVETQVMKYFNIKC